MTMNLTVPPAGAFDADDNQSDTVNLPDNLWTRGIWVGSAGNVKVTTVNGHDVTFTGALAGTIIPVRAKRIWSTGTTASSLLGLY